MHTQLRAQSTFLKLNFGNRSQRVHNKRYQSFLSRPFLHHSFTLFQLSCPGLQIWIQSNQYYSHRICLSKKKRCLLQKQTLSSSEPFLFWCKSVQHVSMFSSYYSLKSKYQKCKQLDNSLAFLMLKAKRISKLSLLNGILACCVLSILASLRARVIGALGMPTCTMNLACLRAC